MIKALILFILFSGTISAQRADTLRMLFLGDIMQHKEQLEAALIQTSIPGKRSPAEPASYNYSSYFSHLKSYFEKADIVGANMETTFAPPPFAGYPAFRSPGSLAAECVKSGINLMFAANNHSADAGSAGLRGSIETYEKLEVPYTGIYRSGEDEELLNPLIIEKRGFKIAFLNYTYGTNGIRTPLPFIIKRLTSAEVEKDLDLARSKSVDLICAAVHWGEEYMTEPGEYQLKWERELYSKGVDIIIGSHPHVPQDVAVYRDSAGKISKITAYSLGNAISNMTAKNTRIGVMLEIAVTRDSTGKREICEPQKHLIWTVRPTLKGENYSILPIKDYLTNSQTKGKLREHDLILNYYKQFNKE
ncbi:MAG: capsular biosynthesis protein [Bacteroidetes bacterium HGW-Bacteroidetes-8]|jgi:poly-gamma-glutamate synthesis protein (capsule biosynthesis protein)|nr:MAG: capsular biosynthesis protein [Bacteroidetes bacterium HGW-Bacteroidetes-8]